MDTVTLPDLFRYDDLALQGLTRHGLDRLIEAGEFERVSLGPLLRSGLADDTTSDAAKSSFATSEFVARLQEAPPAESSREWDAWRIYGAVQTETGEAALKPSDDPVLLRAVLHSLTSTARSQSMGSRQVRSEDRLAWELLVQVFGSEAAVEEVVGSVR